MRSSDIALRTRRHQITKSSGRATTLILAGPSNAPQMSATKQPRVQMSRSAPVSLSVARTLLRYSTALVLCGEVLHSQARPQANSLPPGTLLRDSFTSSAELTDFAVHPSGQWVALVEQAPGDYGSLRLWAIDGEVTSTFNTDEPEEFERLLFSPNGEVLVAVSKARGAFFVRAWTAFGASGAIERPAVRIELSTPVRSIAISPDSRRLALGVEGHVAVYDLPSGRLVRSIGVNTHLGWVRATYSADGRHLFASGGPYGAISMFDAETGARVRDFEVYQPMRSGYVPEYTRMLSSSDGAWLVCACKSDMGAWLLVWNARTGAVVAAQSVPSPLQDISVDVTTGEWLSVSGETLSVWSPQRWTVTRSFRRSGRRVASASNGTFIAVLSRDTLSIWLPDWDASLLAQRPDIRASLAPRDRFETTPEYAKRIEDGRLAYVSAANERLQRAARDRDQRMIASRRPVRLGAQAVTLGAYDADARQYSAVIDGVAVVIDIEPDDARLLSQRRQEILVNTTAQLAPDEKTTIRGNFFLVHPVSGALYRIGPSLPPYLLPK